MNDIFKQLFQIENEAQAIIENARNDAEKSINQIKRESASELEAIRKTTDLLEKQRITENNDTRNSLQHHNEEVKNKKLNELKSLVARNRKAAIEMGLQLMEKIK